MQGPNMKSKLGFQCNKDFRQVVHFVIMISGMDFMELVNFVMVAMVMVQSMVSHLKNEEYLEYF